MSTFRDWRPLRAVLLATATLMLAPASPGGAAWADTTESVAGSPLDFDVALVLSDELCATSKRKIPKLSKKAKAHLQEKLCPALEDMVAATFKSHTRYATLPSADQNSRFDIVLTPRLTDVSVGNGAAWATREILLLLEWRVTSVGGDTLWLKAIRGSAAGKMGTAFSMEKRFREDLDVAVADLTQNTRAAFGQWPKFDYSARE